MNWQSIPVTVVRNPRARKIWVKVRSCKGVEVVLPYRVSSSEVPSILERHRDWIMARLEDLEARGEGLGMSPVPESVRLEFLDREYSVSQCERPRPQLAVEGDVLRLGLPAGSGGEGALLLQRWLLNSAKGCLPRLCRELAAEYGVTIGGVQVRNQRSRWGSCSARAGISLNAKLLFLPRRLVVNVILHELCHVEHRNHGPRFWAALRDLDPQTETHERELRLAWEALPAWSKWR